MTLHDLAWIALFNTQALTCPLRNDTIRNWRPMSLFCIHILFRFSTPITKMKENQKLNNGVPLLLNLAPGIFSFGKVLYFLAKMRLHRSYIPN